MTQQQTQGTQKLNTQGNQAQVRQSHRWRESSISRDTEGRAGKHHKEHRDFKIKQEARDKTQNQKLDNDEQNQESKVKARNKVHKAK